MPNASLWVSNLAKPVSSRQVHGPLVDRKRTAEPGPRRWWTFGVRVTSTVDRNDDECDLLAAATAVLVPERSSRRPGEPPVKDVTSGLRCKLSDATTCVSEDRLDTYTKGTMTHPSVQIPCNIIRAWHNCSAQSTGDVCLHGAHILVHSFF